MELATELQSLMELTKSELAAAQEHQWDQVAKLEEKRLLMIQQLMHQQDADNLDSIRFVFEQLIDQQSALLQYAMTRKSEIADSLARLRHGKKAVEAYKQL